MSFIKRFIFGKGVRKPESSVAMDLASEVLKTEGVFVSRRDPSYKVIESYYVQRPFAKVSIVSTTEGPQYFVEEYGLEPDEKITLDLLMKILMDEIRPPVKSEDIKDLKGYTYREIERIIDKYKSKLNLVGARRYKILYYIERNLLGYGPIDPLMRDPNIEDISCNGVNIPIYVWHRKYESIPTNIIFTDEDYLNEFVMKLVHMSGKHISVAFPIVDAMLPEKHRLAATFGREVSVKGPTFTVRKFREKPFSITELIKSNVLNPVMSAYLWILIEHLKTLMIAGGTGAGKTTMLNAISLFIKPGMKIVTVEETPELNLPHSNWVQLTTRETYLVGQKRSGTSIELYDLVKLSLRYRPDYIIVGEVRGSEAFVLFQAMATGHGGLSTIHAETLDYAIKRLTSKPMNIPPTYMKLMNVFLHVSRIVTRVEKGVVKVNRRVTVIQEVDDYNKYITIAKWLPASDTFEVDLSKSIHLKDIADKRGVDIEDIIEEIYRRTTVLSWMIYKDILDPWDVSRIIFNYYTDPVSVYEKARSDLEEAEVEAPPPVKAEAAVVIEETGETRELGESTRELFEKTREIGK
ncbi:MAG: type II/IV secretion system ATPase subunit [Desulfurococcaceae archaeon]